MAGLHLCGTPTVHHGGASDTTRGGGQPLHPIYGPEERIADTRAANVADSVMYREALARVAEERGWSVHWYDRARVFQDAAAALGGKDLDASLHAMGRSIGPPWQAKQKLAAAAALAAA